MIDLVSREALAEQMGLDARAFAGEVDWKKASWHKIFVDRRRPVIGGSRLTDLKYAIIRSGTSYGGKEGDMRFGRYPDHDPYAGSNALGEARRLGLPLDMMLASAAEAVRRDRERPIEHRVGSLAVMSDGGIEYVTSGEHGLDIRSVPGGGPLDMVHNDIQGPDELAAVYQQWRGDLDYARTYMPMR